MRRTVLGAPRVRVLPPAPPRALVGVRRDVAAFLGVAPRGPARRPVAPLQPDGSLAAWLGGELTRSVAVPVDSWGEYRRLFGGFEGPGRLPYAVSSFFDQGGRRAWIVRVVHDHGDPVLDAAGRCASSLPGGTALGVDLPAVKLLAADEGSWGARLAVRLAFRARPIACDVAASTTSELVVAVDEWAPAGTTVRVRVAGGSSEVRFVDSSTEEPEPTGPGQRRRLVLSAALTGAPEAVDVVLGRVEVLDRDPAHTRREVVDAVGLRADHPRWLGRALVEESRLVWPAPATADTGAIAAPADLAAFDAAAFTEESDRWASIEPADFRDPAWVPGDPPGGGIHCLEEVDEIGLVVAPDLYDPQPLDPPDEVREVPGAGATFADCLDLGPVVTGTPPATGLVGLRLDPLDPVQRDAIVAAQSALADVAERRSDLTLLLDVPPGLSHRQVVQWRTAFDSAQVAAYHPWLDVAAPDDARESLVRIGGSAFAAGIVADRERRLGISHGPANQVAVGAVRPAVVVPAVEHDELHPDGINVFLQERDGVVLRGARTLSRRPELRQLTVARLMAVIRLTLLRELAWVVFEPNGPRLWADVRRVVEGWLRRLFDAGAFAGDTTASSYFVRCGETTMSRNDLGTGRLVCRVGVAPSEPAEYIDVDLTLLTRDA